MNQTHAVRARSGHVPARLRKVLEPQELSKEENAVSKLASPVYSVPRPNFMYRVTFGGVVRLTTDPIEVARIRRAYPNAQVEIIPYRG